MTAKALRLVCAWHVQGKAEVSVGTAEDTESGIAPRS